MTGRRRTSPGDADAPRRRTPHIHTPTSVAQAETALFEVAERGRSTADGGTQPAVPNPEDATLRQTMDKYARLGDEPPRFSLANNDASHAGHGAHTLDRHGPDIPLPRDPTAKTVEGRIYGDPPWSSAENWSYTWTDPSTMHRTINDYVRDKWETIRSDLAIDNRHEAVFDAGHRVGHGYYNDGMFGAGPRNARFATTSFVKIRIRLVPGSDPPEPFILTAFPSGLM